MIEIQNKRANQLLWLVILLLLAGSTWVAGKKYLQERNDRIRISQNYEASNQELTFYKSLNRELVAHNQALVMKVEELRDVYPDIIREIKNLKIRPGSVHSYTETVIENEKHITTVLRDSMISDTVVVRVFNYRDDFYHVSGIAKGDSQKVSIQSKDSLIQVVYKGKRIHPWLWIFSRRKLEQSILCKNPNAKVQYSKHIEIVKP